MRNFAALLVAILCLLSVACVDGVMLQDAQQGEWANFHDTAHKISRDARTPATPEK